MEHNQEVQSGCVKARCTINVGSRNSQLALIQTNIIINQLRQFYENNPDVLDKFDKKNACDGIEFNVVPMTTSGDQILDKALPDIGAKSLFTKELEVALIDGKVDFVVHSLKDLPTTLPEGCVIGAVAKRDDRDDAIVLKKSLSSRVDALDLIFGSHKNLFAEGQACKIGTSSQRRIAMLKRCNQELECTNIRGNLNTRLAKLDKDDGEYAAIVLAKAGLNRMEWSERVSHTLSPSKSERLAHWCYAVGQGAIAVECRMNDDRILNLLAPICDMTTTYEAIAERSLMKKLEGGCSVPLGVRTTWSGNHLRLDAIVLSLDGKKTVAAHDQSCLESPLDIKDNSELSSLSTGIILSHKLNTRIVSGNIDACAKLGISVANKMIDLGCLELMVRKK